MLDEFEQTNTISVSRVFLQSAPKTCHVVYELLAGTVCIQVLIELMKVLI